ncbi:MAG TPA: DHHA1 domain-containing protein [Trinickia sp.]|uniref:DHHA1 domain-containing protein n=1 Tax=Trinickia sp. TaxID=2571163 RepID=UPI002BAD7083|nr:DHHA1 domain-containing protein [Trinickia sp.]HTI18910.1 DHHA1 domain-containing protein [Trinickia sp.]
MTAHANDTTGEASARPAFDVFNGDADGICALHQLRLARPAQTTLITGVKRDVGLLSRIPSPGADAPIDVTVLDISLDTNHADLVRLLDAGARVAYYDHHSARKAFPHPRLRLAWDDSPAICTSLIVDRELGGRYRGWAIAAAFGDNLDDCASRLSNESGFGERETAALQSLGRILNYNAYGETVADLHVPPAELYRELQPYRDPFDFLSDSQRYRGLADAYRSDTARLESIKPHCAFDGLAVYVLPDAPWSRRVSGVLANRLASAEPGSSFAVLTERADGRYAVSVRSGDPTRRPANELCEQFASGGGRRGSAGINQLPAGSLGTFIDAFRAYFDHTPVPGIKSADHEPEQQN